MRTHIIVSLLSLCACESSEQVVADMERALFESNTAIVGTLLSTEILSHVYDTPSTTLRHGTSVCGCPCISKIGEAVPYILTLDYPTGGCVPQSQLLPTALTGHAVVEFDGSGGRVTWDGLLFALEHAVSGDLEGNVSTGAAQISPRGSFAIGPADMEISVDVQVDEGGITVDGEVTVTPADEEGESPEPRQLHLDGLSLPYDRLAPPCPTPLAGSITQTHEREKKSSTIRFDEPGDGFVTVERDGQISEATDWCAYASELW